MPNWCSTTYRIQGDSKDINSFHKLIQRLEKRKKPYVPNGFGNLWLGCIVNKLGGDWNKVYCRGEIVYYEKNEDGTLSIMTETAWSEMSEWRHFIESKYPSFKIYFSSEECGCEYYITNDSEGRYFPERYYLDSGEEPLYFETITEAADCVSELVGEQTEANLDAINKALEKYMAEKEDIWYSFHEFTIVKDQ